MCLDGLNKDFQNIKNGSGAMDANWQEIFQVYLRKIEHDTNTTLEMVKGSVERIGLTFNQKLKSSLLRLTNAR